MGSGSSKVDQAKKGIKDRYASDAEIKNAENAASSLKATITGTLKVWLSPWV